MDKCSIIQNLIATNADLRVSLRHMQIERDNAALRLRNDQLERYVAKLQRQIRGGPAAIAESIFRGLE